MTSSEAPIAFRQPGLAGTLRVSVREGRGPPPIKGLDTTLLVIQKHPPLPRYEMSKEGGLVRHSLMLLREPGLRK